MALLWMDGFDHYGTGVTARDNMLRGIYGAAGSGVTAARSRTGGCSLYVEVAGNLYQPQYPRILGDTYETVGAEFAMWVGSLPVNAKAGIHHFHTAGNSAQITLQLSPTGRLEVRRGATAGVILAESADGTITTSGWQHIGWRIKIHPTDGAVEVRVNGITIISLSPTDEVPVVNTAGAGVPGAAIALFGGGAGSGVLYQRDIWIDDYFVWNTLGDTNNDFIGDKRVGLIIPNDDTAQSDWTPVGSGTGFGAISEILQDADATYIETQEVGHVSEFELQDVVGDIGAISAVQTYVIQRKTVAGVCNTQVGLISDSAETLGADRPITEQYTYYTDVFETDPNTAAPWTKTGLSAARLKIERAV